MTQRLRSSLWSSETLVQGMQNISEQPQHILSKTEYPDDDLEFQLQVP